MKKEVIQYTCDNCSEVAAINKDDYATTTIHHDWLRIYVKLRPMHNSKTKVHFCCKQCAIEFLQKLA